jgi:hypothetical protein
MRRLDIINAVIKIRQAVSDSKINEVIMAPLTGKDRYDPEIIMESFQKFSNHFERFGDNEKRVLKIFGLDGIENPKLWAKIMTSEKTESREAARPFYRGMTFMQDYLHKIVDLLKQDHLEYVRHDNYISIDSPSKDNHAVITVILPEKDNESSHPNRLIKILESIGTFYSTISSLQDHKDNDLSVIAIDSGSDKSFDFLGAAKVVTAVKELVIELWDRVVFYREKKLNERIDLIAKSLPVIEKINSLEKGGKMEREQAEIFRRNILDGAKAFIECGAILPEFESHSSYNPRQLMAPEPKLLTMPDEIKDNSNSENFTKVVESTSDKEDLNSEERELLKKLLARESKRKPRKKPDA